MNEVMGLVFGVYDAKTERFVPGGASLHNCMAGHGLYAETFERVAEAGIAQNRVWTMQRYHFRCSL